MSHSVKYRADIDGLRAVAVLSVLLFHSELSLGTLFFRGGFLGVDVFFVISGFLITSILCCEFKETGRISIPRFYDRRLRRIAPALISVCGLSFLAAQSILLPNELDRFNQSLVATLAFVANVFFWLETGYFSPAADQQPLLHMWSLAVEEQYYVVFPLALWASVRWFGWRGTLIAMAAIILGSAALQAWGAMIMRSASFYLTPFRVWELLAGASLALLADRKAFPSPTIAPMLGLLGAALVLVPITFYDPLASNSVFPVTLAAVLGTCLIVMSGPHGPVGKVLSARPLVGIGLISYSLYLVHQPLFAFARVRTLEEPSQALMAGLTALCVPLAFVLWHFVETPFRRRQRVSNRAFYTLLTTSTALLVAVGLGGVPEPLAIRWSAQAMQVAEIVSAPTDGLSAICHDNLTSPVCTTDEAPRTFLWGDSYAMHLVPGLVAQGVSFRQVTRRGCAPHSLEETRPLDAGPITATERRCEIFNAEVLDLIATEALAGRLNQVIISSRAYGVKGGSLRHIPSEENLSPERVATELSFVLLQLETLGVSVGLVGAPPPAHFDPGQCYLRSVAYEDQSSECKWTFPAQHGAYPLSALADQHGGQFLDLSEILCPDDLCAATQNDILIYRDNGHLTPNGSEYVMQSHAARRFLADLGIPGDTSE